MPHPSNLLLSLYDIMCDFWPRAIFVALHCMFSIATCSFSLIKKDDCTGHVYSTTGLTSDFIIKLWEDFSVSVANCNSFSRPSICNPCLLTHPSDLTRMNISTKWHIFACWSWQILIALCKVIQYNNRFWVPRCGFRILPLQIPDSKTQKIPDFSFWFAPNFHISFSRNDFNGGFRYWRTCLWMHVCLFIFP